MKTMSLTVNAWSVDWFEDGRRRIRVCELKIECGGKPTRGIAVFMKDGKPQRIAPYFSSPCCTACAAAVVTREGLRGAITIKQLAASLARP